MLMHRYSAACGFLCCRSKCGRDPLVKQNEPYQLKNGEDLLWVGIFMFVFIAFLVFVNFDGDDFVGWIMFGVGVICFLIWVCILISLRGQRHLAMDKRNKDLVMSVSAYCCYCKPVYLREKIASFSNIDKFYIDSQYLYVGLKQSWKDDIKISDIKQKPALECERELTKIEAWWKEKYIASYDSINDIKYGGVNETESNPLLISNVASQSNSFAITDRLKDLIMDIKLQDSEKGKLIDMAYDLNEDGMIEEYERVNHRVGDDDKDKLIQLLVDKADTIIKVFKVRNMILNDEDNKENEQIVIAPGIDVEEEEGNDLNYIEKEEGPTFV